MKNVTLIFLCLLAMVISGCSSGNNDAPVLGNTPSDSPTHVAAWLSLHGEEANNDLRGCQGCHGFDFKGGGDAVSCFNCHSSGPPFVGAHPVSWNADALLGHQLNFQTALSDQTPWTTCAVTACHGPKLEGGTAGPTCQNNTANCHLTGTNGWPPAPANHSTFNVAAAATDAVHGRAAKGETNPNQSMGNYCLLCHGTQPNTFDGGFVSDPAILNNVSGNCSAASCHPTATAHPSNWASTRAGNNVFHNNGTLTDEIQSASCALCHTTTGTSPASPFQGAPTCFASTYNGLNCHATGPGGAPHAVPYTDPQLHGLAAKADPSATTGLVYCQSCHAEAGGAGSNPRFNVPNGTMGTSCEDCHLAGAHPTRGDRWTFDLDTNHDITGENLTRRTHFATGNSVSAACALCHNINDANTGFGTAPGCNTCHASATTFNLNCTYCHELPPVTNATDLTGAAFVDHSMMAGGNVSDISNHENCSICHGASQNGTTGTLQSKGADYVLFSGTGQGGNHLDNCIDVNSDVGYQDVNAAVAERFGCAAACHPNDAKHQRSDSGFITIDGRYTTGTIACNDCHGYPPDGVTAAPGATVASHVGGTLGADLLTFHGECQTCHGTKDNGTGGHDPLANYDPAVNHYNGQINMNSATGYDPTTGGCDTAGCHANDIDHQVPPTSGLTVQGGDYGTGSCTSCHDYPPKGDKIPLTAPGTTTPVSHMGSDGTGAKLLLAHGECQVCHGTKDNGSGAHDAINPPYVPTKHQDDQIQMNTDTGYNAATFSCESASCHVGGQSPALSDSSLPVDLLALGASAACDTCHGGLLTDATPISTNAHTAHLVSTIGVSMNCDTCHGHLGVGATHNQGNGIVDPANVDVPLADGLATGSYSGPGTKQCSNVYCHGPGNVNVADWDGGTGGACGDCHGASITGRPDGVNEPSGGSHLTASHAAEACTTCHPHAGVDTTNHVNGTVFTPANANGDAQISIGGAITAHNYGVTIGSSPDPDGFEYSASTCTTSCHSSGIWGNAGGCDFCHGYPPDGTGGSTDHFTRTGLGSTDSDFFNAHATCATCHGVGGNLVPPAIATARSGAVNLLASGGDRYLDPAMHNDGKVQMNGYDVALADGTDDKNAGYDGAGGCTKACHAPTVILNGTIQANTLEIREFGGGDCTSCHNGTGSGATLVNDNSPHARNTTLAGYSCEDCHTAHGAGTIEIPNNATVGINYSSNGESGIALGSAVATGATEAEICWNCHAGEGVSEWGVNTDTNGGGANYNFGTLNQLNWVGATWSSGTAKFGYKSGAIQSTHSVNDAATGPGMDAVADIRCSYCHDVHDLNTLASDSSTGKPYLRGSWMGNPYPEDGAPQSGDSWTTNQFGAVPRGTNAANELGGFQIDQNNGNPTSTWTADSSAGLCEVCHGDGDGTFTATEINGLNEFGSASTDWVGTNGHANAALGGDGTGAVNIFSITDRNASPPTFVDDDADKNGSESNPAMAYQQISVGSNGNRAFGFRSSNSEPDGWNLAPRTTTDRAHDSYNWGADTNNGLDVGYHNFSCSKCHNPHASRLPRLMITNCLDTKHNSWDETVSVIPNQGTNNNDGGGSINAENAGVTFSNTTSAQNCHRVKDPAFSNSRGTGWNNVTPW